MNLHYDEKTKKIKIKYPLLSDSNVSQSVLPVSPVSAQSRIHRIIRPEYKVSLAVSDFTEGKKIRKKIPRKR